MVRERLPSCFKETDIECYQEVEHKTWCSRQTVSAPNQTPPYNYPPPYNKITPLLAQKCTET